ncbi:hypothetical protein [Nostoc sp. MS1]|uniref:hypothetical protein n=1 Tax=Nostoc sp. MS1 TaxID=2764711 RepID=UPI001CC65D26|nr:hypothetical protein [Nostoc sp. MS1]BCL37163.1 hypothetical protein NSMS1_36100 [Nostoc sp. MS1]
MNQKYIGFSLLSHDESCSVRGGIADPSFVVISEQEGKLINANSRGDSVTLVSNKQKITEGNNIVDPLLIAFPSVIPQKETTCT